MKNIFLLLYMLVLSACTITEDKRPISDFSNESIDVSQKIEFGDHIAVQQRKIVGKNSEFYDVWISVIYELKDNDSFRKHYSDKNLYQIEKIVNSVSLRALVHATLNEPLYYITSNNTSICEEVHKTMQARFGDSILIKEIKFTTDERSESDY